MQGNLMEPDVMGDTMNRSTDDLEAGSSIRMPESSFSDHMPDIDLSRSPTSGSGSLPARGSEKWGGPSDIGSGGGAGTGHGIKGGAGDMGQGLGALAGDRDILLIWVLDSSASMFGKIEQMKQEITVLFKSYDRRMAMIVISFDSEPVSIISKPTNQVREVIAAFDKVKAEGKKKQVEEINYFLKNYKVHPDAGVENTMKAIQYAARTRSNSRRKVVIALMTDEVGDDSNERNATRTLADLKRGEISFFVFGPQSNLKKNVITTTTSVSHPSFKKNGVPGGKVNIRAQSDSGSAMPTEEPVTFRWGILSPKMTTAAKATYPSGLGPYYLSQLVEGTGGKYYFFAGSSSPTSRFKPIYDSRHRSYREMARALNNLRKSVKEWESRRTLPSSFASQAALDSAKTLARTNLRLAEKLISRLKNYTPGEEDTVRVNAHRELFLAELYAAKFRLLEYIAALDDAKGLRYDTVESGNTRTVYSAAISDSLVSGISGLLKNAPVNFPTQQETSLVIRSEAEWQKAIEKHSALRMLQEKPRVNFKHEMIIVVSAGMQYRSDARTDIITTFKVGDKLMVVTDQYLPQASRRNIDRPYFPNSVLVVPKFKGEVKFIPTSEWAEIGKVLFGNSIKGGSKSAEALIQARIARAGIEKKYPATVWSSIVTNVSVDSFRCRQVSRQSVITPPKCPTCPKPPKPPKPQPKPVTPTIPGGA